MRIARSRNLGEFVLGERPDPIDWPFQFADGTPIPLTGFTAAGRIAHPDGTITDVTANITIPAPLTGVVRMEWPLDILVTQAGRWRIRLWAGNASDRRYCSQRFHFYASQPVGTIPAI